MSFQYIPAMKEVEMYFYMIHLLVLGDKLSLISVKRRLT